MSSTSILIVEDNLIVAEDIKEMLLELGYSVSGIARTYEDAMEQIGRSNPALALIDIRLASEKDGINFAEYLYAESKIPYLFVTASADPVHMNRAKRVHPWGYVLKPFRKDDLYAAIEIALSNFKFRESQTPSETKSIQIADTSGSVQVSENRIKYVRSSGNYVEIHLLDKKMVIRSTLKSLKEQLSPDQFLQIHKSFIVNRSMISYVSAKKVQIEQETLPVGRAYKIP